ncbi:hypothetical protein E2C01_057451 [Portunus trituberculatus]|uniref:Uncharacterized protein n=1 Tax=Portunus trituberculatus TaxID=210409 RepID=A0A5B7H014_PORTR|nr:hypothetical protein [Portunus trituberculatus]
MREARKLIALLATILTPSTVSTVFKSADSINPYVPAIVYERLHQWVRSDGDRSRNQEFSRLMFELHARFLESDGV